MFVRRIRVGGERWVAAIGSRLLAWLSVALAALLLAPSMASAAAWAMSGRTSQGLSVRLHVSFNLSKVNRLVIRWRATCTSGTTFTDSTAVSRIPVSPFPKFHSSGGYVFSGQGTSGRTYRFAVSTDLHGSLLRNIRARGTWSAQALIRDASGNQVDSCSTGLIRWRAHGSFTPGS
jgi:hypothetical protein